MARDLQADTDNPDSTPWTMNVPITIPVQLDEKQNITHSPHALKIIANKCNTQKNVL
ncbi:hypothetical protein CHELA1G11_10526 [Hyphomicrobiales bacterium]|nr:hypothetical protein CHELA1G11_10526 [Hyphomicrobiales bacterium]CAH1674060.1 hypothetical protein CHELA1G2_13778 [Hyphomicrobiales bacterium]